MGCILKYSNAIASASSSISTKSEMIAKIGGTEGSIMIDSRWHEAEGYTYIRDNRSTHIDLPIPGNGFTYQIKECAQCIRSGLIESNLWSHQNSMDLMNIMDEIRNQVGLRYPFE